MATARATLVAIGVVVAAAALGQALAGDDPVARLDQLPQTPLLLPIGVWIVVAVLYYAISGVVVYRLARRWPSTRTAIVGYLALMLANEVWNFLLFGLEPVWPAAVGMIGFAVVAVVVGRLLWRVDDPVPFRVYLPYLAWVVLYDVPWMILTWMASS